MQDIKIGRMVLGSVGTNCYFLYREEDKNCIVVDPADQGERIFGALNGKGFKVSGILLTHGHFDHILGVEALKEQSEAYVYAAESALEELKTPKLNLSAQTGRVCTVKPDKLLKDGEKYTIAGMEFQVIFTPGHTQGSACFYFEEAGFLVSGDTLFEESVGRTDFPTGSMSQIVRSIVDKLYILPDDTKVYPGHGEQTTIGHEKKYNPFTVID